jgi:hypothetical protein
LGKCGGIAAALVVLLLGLAAPVDASFPYAAKLDPGQAPSDFDETDAATTE